MPSLQIFFNVFFQRDLQQLKGLTAWAAISLCGVIMLVCFAVKRRFNNARRLRVGTTLIERKSKEAIRIESDNKTILRCNARLEDELQYRIQKNLEMILMLLNHESASLEHAMARDAFLQSQTRIKAIYLVHRQIFFSQGEEYVEMSAYVRQMVTSLKKYFMTPETVDFKLDLQIISLRLCIAEPLGLFMNEVITNCLRHAFIKRATGDIHISMKQASDRHITLEIKDNGVQYKGTDFWHKNDQTLGIGLIHGLAGQLDAKLVFARDHGLSVCLDFMLGPASN
ncbi:sensor histidine kinase [Mucilaginibacter aquaedulcis]|uniref:sensor histidine kinase n=1 Tax=Mucilaginibacter aquaedulcis TaxID=1187081 RepID=UPI0025B2EF2C|nr:histidine kinase dimerization/phosphoacceptor domain -containing protein [Mucilaginibacter aquaedulcis]MDN3548878.1 histidine kinase dimerization/phosphoacceptor domain -containing protein [Mucilaginibacter aquaedulcis]